MSLLGLDIGTTGCKAVAFREDGTLLAGAYREYPLLNPRPGWYELDPEAVWRHMTACLREVNAQLTGDPVQALAVSAQGEAVIPISSDGQVLGNSPVSSDNRAVRQADWLRERLGAEMIYELTGQPVSTLFSLPKIMWWKAQDAGLYARARKFLCYGDFAVLKLGLEPTIDYTMAARTLGFDIRRLAWSPEMLNAAGIEPDRLATPLPSGSVIGEIPRRIAETLGFTRPVQVALGGHDQPCAALGAGVLQSGEALYSIGTTEAIAAIAPGPNPKLGAINCPCYPHVLPGLFIVLVGSQTGGRLLRWYRDVLGAEEREIAAREGRDVYDVIVEQIPEGPGRLLVLPYFAGSGTLRNDPEAKGAILGLTFDTQRGDIVRALLEGITFEQALSVRQLRAVGLDIQRFKAVGGGARSAAWLQIKADILGAPISAVEISEAACLGAAVLAGLGTGVYPTPQQAIAQTLAIRAVFQPRAENAAYYRERLDVYEQIYPLLKQLQPAL